MEKEKQFLQELKALLEKYDVSICFDCEGDTYGIYAGKIILRIRDEILPGNRFAGRKDIFTVNGYHLDSLDID